MSVARNQRFFNSSHPCPICGGWEKIERGQGRRCAGYESDDGVWVHCTREDHAGDLPLIANSSTYAHFMQGKCKCGVQHGATAPKPRQEPPKVVKFERGRTKTELWGDLGPIIAEYDYLDEQGVLRYQVVRFGNPKTFRQCRPDGAGKWIANLGSVKLLPYRLPELIAADPSQTVYIPEGEKDVESLRNRGLVATTNSGGALKWQAEFSKYFAGRRVVIIPDNDPDGKGQRHAEQVAKSLKSVTTSVKVLALPAEIKDVSDWLTAGHEPEELSRLAQAAPEWGEQEGTTQKEEEQDPFASYDVHPAKLLTLSQLNQLPPIEYLVRNELQKRTIATVYGPPGAGKSFVVLDYALEIAQEQAVVYVASEGASGYLQRALAWIGYRNLDESNPNFRIYIDAFNLMSPVETKKFLELIRPLSPALVVIDTMAWCMAGFGGNENDTEDMMQFMVNCNALVKALKCTLIIVHHTSKSGATERGNSALRGGSATMIEVTQDDDLIRVSCDKQKDGKPFDTKYFQLLDVETTAGESAALVAAQVSNGVAKRNKPSPKQLDILEKLNLAVFSDVGAKSSQLMQMLEIGNSKSAASMLYTNLSTLKTKGYILQSAKGDPYFITADGQEVLKAYRPMAT